MSVRSLRVTRLAALGLGVLLALGACGDEADPRSDAPGATPTGSAGPGAGDATDSAQPAAGAPGRPAQGPVTRGRRDGPPIVRLLSAPVDARHTPPARSAPSEALLPPPADDTQAWWPVPRVDAREPLDAEALAARPDAQLALGPGGGGWLRVLPVARNGDVRLTATLHARGLQPDPQLEGDGGGRISLLEFVRAPDPADLQALPQLLSAAHGSGFVRGDEQLEVELSASLRGATRFVGVLVSQPLRVDDPDAGLTVGDLTLERPSLVEQARSLTGDPELFGDPAALPVAPVSIRHVTRPALLLRPGAAAELAAVAPDAPTRLRAWVGAVPHADFDVGARLDLHVALHDAADAGGPALAQQRVPLRIKGRMAARWQPFELDLPATLRGRELLLRLRADAPAGAPGDAPAETRGLVAVAAPRLQPAAPARPGPNVVVISLDTLRADRLGAYGYTRRETSPRLDALAAESAVFLDTWTQAPFTLPSHVSLFSGQFPSVHGVRMHLDRADPVATHMLAELLHAAGWTTGAFTAGGYVSPDFGFARGFERYGSLEPLANLDSERVVSMIERYPGTSVEMFAEQQWDAVLGWIDAHADESFLLFAHTYVVHQFDPPPRCLEALGLEPGVRAADDELATWLTRFDTPPADVLARIDALYDATVRQADEAVGQLLDRLAELGLDDETIVVVTSDHGKELGERGAVAHGHSLHEELLRVPLIVKVPGDRPRRVERPAMLVDVLPTLLDALGLDTPPGVQGVSLRGELDPRRVLYAEVDDLAVQRALRQGRFKTIHAPLDAEAFHANTVEERSYDLRADPGELHPLPSDPERLQRLRDFRAGLEALREALGGGEGGGALSPEMAEHLRQLGYTVGDG